MKKKTTKQVAAFFRYIIKYNYQMNTYYTQFFEKGQHIWLTQGEKAQRDTFYSFLNDKLTKEILDDLHYQFIKILKEKGLVSLKTLFIDGTKIEANADIYTFVWRGTVNYHLARLLENIDKVYLRYNQFLESQNYDVTYKIQKETMFKLLLKIIFLSIHTLVMIGQTITH